MAIGTKPGSPPRSLCSREETASPREAIFRVPESQPASLFDPFLTPPGQEEVALAEPEVEVFFWLGFTVTWFALIRTGSARLRTSSRVFIDARNRLCV
jgi:hypothetical protein